MTGSGAAGGSPWEAVPPDEVMTRLLLWFKLRPELYARLRELGRELGEPRFAAMQALLIDAFLFEHEVPWDGSALTPVEAFLATVARDDAEARALSGLRSSVFGLFEVQGVLPRHGLTLRDMVVDVEYDVLETTGSRDLKPGTVLIGRILPYRDQWVMTGSCVFVRDHPGTMMARFRLLSRSGEEVRCLDLLRWDTVRVITSAVGVENLDDAVWRLRERCAELGIPIDLDDLPQRIEGTGTVLEAFPEFFEPDLPSRLPRKDLEEVVALAAVVVLLHREGGREGVDEAGSGST